MKYLRRIFENTTSDEVKFIEECFLDVTENYEGYFDIRYECEDEGNEDIDDGEDSHEYREKAPYQMAILSMRIDLGKNLTLEQPVASNLYTGKVNTTLDFLIMKSEKMKELLEDIQIAVERVKDRYPNATFSIWANRREEMELQVTIVK